MAFVFEMPEVGEGVVEAEIAEWKVRVGDAVRVDQPICEITTDKASLEITSPVAGVVVAIHARPGEIVKVHAPIMEFDTESSAAAAPAAAAPPAAALAPPTAPSRPPVAAAPTAPELPRAAAPRASAPTPPASKAHASAAPRLDVDALAKATPSVRRHAQELDIDVQRVDGTGADGRVTHADVERFARGESAPPLPVAPVALPQVRGGADTVVPITGVRRKIAERMAIAKRSAPHFTYVEEIDCTELVGLRTKLKARAEKAGVSLTYMPFFAKASSIALRDFPNCNAWMDEERSELLVRGEHNLGVACDTPNGLMVPVIRNVESKSILQIAAEMQDLFARTRAGKATREELMGSTFTLTSVGSIGGVLATPILNVPEVAILGLNQIRKRPVVDADDNIVVRHMTYLSPSFDHRIIDGAVAARFVARLKDLLEHPEQLLLELI